MEDRISKKGGNMNDGRRNYTVSHKQKINIVLCNTFNSCRLGDIAIVS